MPAAGLPVASIDDLDLRRARSRASASSVTNVVPLRAASRTTTRASIALGRPAGARERSRARASGARSRDGDEVHAGRARDLRRGTSSRTCRRRSARRAAACRRPRAAAAGDEGSRTQAVKCATSTMRTAPASPRRVLAGARPASRNATRTCRSALSARPTNRRAHRRGCAGNRLRRRGRSPPAALRRRTTASSMRCNVLPSAMPVPLRAE